MDLPKLKNGKHLILKADCKTGHILDNNGNIYIGEERDFFIIMDNEEEAFNFANKQLLINPEYEFIIYNDKAEFVTLIDSPDGASMYE